MSETATCPRLSRDSKETGESALMAVTGRFAEFLSAPQCLGEQQLCHQQTGCRRRYLCQPTQVLTAHFLEEKTSGDPK
jgi:hypothetical protein